MNFRLPIRDFADRIILVRVTATALGLLDAASIMAKDTPWGIRLEHARRCVGAVVQEITDAN